jgi:hypothetical protein
MLKKEGGLAYLDLELFLPISGVFHLNRTQKL